MEFGKEYIKTFETEAEYLAFKASSGYNEPNVSYIVEDNGVHYNPYVETRVVAKYNITDTTNPTKIGNNESVSGFSAIEIDDIEQPSVVSAYTFSTTGEHTVKYTLTDTTQIGWSAFNGCSSLTSVVIPNSVTSIGNFAFNNCTSLTSCTIGSGVTSIGNQSFNSCTSLTSITIPSGVTSINSNAFIYCNSLTTITVDSNNTVYDSRNNCNAIIATSTNTLVIGCKDSTIPNTVTSIGDFAFDGCASLTSITIPDNVTSIGDYAFWNCHGLTTVTIGSGITSIGGYVFQDCTSLTSVVIPNTVTSIGTSAFNNCTSLTSITIPDSVTSFGYQSFSNCSGLTTVTIGSGLTSIGTYPFRNCSSLTTITVDSNNTVYDSRNNCNAIIATSTNTLVIGCKDSTIPNTVTSIGDYAFAWYTSLTSITIPDNVTSIGGYVFTGCTSLTTVTIGSGITTIDNTAFNGCKDLTSITVDGNNTTYDSRNNCNAIIETSTNTLVIGFKNSTIPNTVTAIGDYAFAYCSSLTSINIPDNITSIGDYAFQLCVGLTSCTIGSGVTSIGGYVFMRCNSLTSITSNAMTPPTISKFTFKDVPTGGTLYVPTGSGSYSTWMSTLNYYLGSYNWTKIAQ